MENEDTHLSDGQTCCECDKPATTTVAKSGSVKHYCADHAPKDEDLTSS